MIADLLAGVIAAFTPCTIVLIPLMLYRFGIWGSPGSRIQIKDLLLFLVGFFISFVAAGLVLQQLLGSDFINVTRLALGSVLVIAGIWQLLGDYSIGAYTEAANPLLIGLLFPLIISISPCVLPLLATVLVNGDNASSVVHLALFGAGMLAPALAAALLGNQVWGRFKRVSRYAGIVTNIGGGILIVSGIYLVFELFAISLGDILLGGLILLLVLIICSYRIFKWNPTIQNIAWLLTIVTTILFSGWYLLSSNIGGQKLFGQELVFACSVGQACPDCDVVSLCFTVVAMLIGLWLAVGLRPGRRLRLRSD